MDYQTANLYYGLTAITYCRANRRYVLTRKVYEPADIDCRETEGSYWSADGSYGRAEGNYGKAEGNYDRKEGG